MSVRIARPGILYCSVIILIVVAQIGWSEDVEHRASRGELNLRSCDFSKCGTVTLNGEWAFFWDTLLTSENCTLTVRGEPDHYIEVPSYWDHLQNIDPEITAQGSATYSLDILMPETSEHLALKFLNITPNARIFVNGILEEEMGRVDGNRLLSRPGNQTVVIPLFCVGDRVNVAVSISNYHNINGGLNRPVSFGRFEDIRYEREKLLTVDAVFLGGILLMGLYQLLLFMMTPRRLAPLFMAMICLLAFLFSGFKHEMVLLALFPGLDGELRTQFIYLALALSPVAFTNYSLNLYPAHFHSWINRSLAVVAGIFSLIILFTSKAFFTQLLIPLEILLFLAMSYNMAMMIRGWHRSRDKHILLSIGGLIFLMGAISFGIVDNAVAVVFQSVAGIFFIYILYQAFLQAYIYSYAFREIDSLSSQKSKLEKRNVELFSLSYIDSLTGICNRRLMDDFLSSNWRVNALSDRPLGMILIDIDDFKAYNEFYGHRQGDFCLIKVAELIRNEMNRLGQDTLARYGGEEFAVIISDIEGTELYEIAEKIRIAVESGSIEHRSSSVSDSVTISLGCSILIPSTGTQAESLLDEAAKALGIAKASGRNRTEIVGSVGVQRSWEPRLV